METELYSLFFDIEKKFLSENSKFVNTQIRWKDNEIDRYDNDTITEFYKNNTYGRKSRWELWNKAIESCKENNIKTIVDIGCGNGHFPFLCAAKDIDAYGIDPRTYTWVDKIFKERFGKKRIFQGTISSVGNYFKSNVDITFDCIAILNYLHGTGHVKDEILNLFSFIKKHSRYLICSEPRWDELGLDNLLAGFTVVKKLETKFNIFDVMHLLLDKKNHRVLSYLVKDPISHYLYKIQ